MDMTFGDKKDLFYDQFQNKEIRLNTWDKSAYFIPSWYAPFDEMMHGILYASDGSRSDEKFSIYMKALLLIVMATTG